MIDSLVLRVARIIADWVLPTGELWYLQLLCLALSFVWMFAYVQKLKTALTRIAGIGMAIIVGLFLWGILMIPYNLVTGWFGGASNFMKVVIVIGVLFTLFMLSALLGKIFSMWFGVARTFFGWVLSIYRSISASPNMFWSVIGMLFLGGLICGEKLTYASAGAGAEWMPPLVIPGISAAFGAVTGFIRSKEIRANLKQFVVYKIDKKNNRWRCPEALPSGILCRTWNDMAADYCKSCGKRWRFDTWDCRCGQKANTHDSKVCPHCGDPRDACEVLPGRRVGERLPAGTPATATVQATSATPQTATAGAAPSPQAGAAPQQGAAPVAADPMAQLMTGNQYPTWGLSRYLKCSKCSYENSQGSLYCSECGEYLPEKLQLVTEARPAREAPPQEDSRQEWEEKRRIFYRSF